MSNKKQDRPDATEKIEEGAIEVINKSDEFIRKNRNILIIAVVAVLAVVGGIIAYKNLYKAPRAIKAQEAIYKAEQYFDRDSFEIALNGNGADVVGFLEVIDQYGGTGSANLAEAYAGICLYNLGQYDEAISHLKKFNSKDAMASPSLYGLIGDCYVNLDKTAEGIKYFEEAAKKADNGLLSPIYLIKAGIAYEALGQAENAKASYQAIIDNYPNSASLPDAMKLLQALEMK